MPWFWKPSSVFSRWARSVFTLDSLDYCSLEQFIMASKARLFKSMTFSKNPCVHPTPVLTSTHVKQFDQIIWSRTRGHLALVGNYENFAQNALMKQHLLDTGNRVLTEASSFDDIW